MRAWHGLTAQTNTFGVLSSIAAVFWMHALLAKQGRLLVSLAGVAMSVGCVLLSRSLISLTSMLFAFFFMTLLLYAPKALRRYIPCITGSFALLLVSYALTVLKLVPGLHDNLLPEVYFFGNSTSRSQIWEIIKDQIQLSPLLGSGYGAYWNGPDPGAPSHIFMLKMYFYPGEAHNGYIEITNDLGFVGLALAFLAEYVRQSLQLMRTDRAQGALYLGLFLQQAIVNLSESTWLQIDSPNLFMIMILAAFALAAPHRINGGDPPAEQTVADSLATVPATTA